MYLCWNEKKRKLKINLNQVKKVKFTNMPKRGQEQHQNTELYQNKR